MTDPQLSSDIEPEKCTCDGGFIYDELGKWVCGKCDEGWIYPTDDQYDMKMEFKMNNKYYGEE
jgi:hypothetical protein